jgi:hypothetical protein
LKDNGGRSNTGVFEDELKGSIKALTKSVEYIHKKYIIVTGITAFLIGFGIGVLITNLANANWIKLPVVEVLLKKSDETIRALQKIRPMSQSLTSEKVSKTGGKPIVDETASIETRRKTEAAEGTKNSPISIKGYKVYVHYARDGDKEKAEAFSHLLWKRGYTFVETEKIKHTSRDIRYFFDEDKATALLLQKHLNDFVAGSSVAKEITVKIKNMGKMYPKAQKGNLEVWVFF